MKRSKKIIFELFVLCNIGVIQGMYAPELGTFCSDCDEMRAISEITKIKNAVRQGNIKGLKRAVRRCCSLVHQSERDCLNKTFIYEDSANYHYLTYIAMKYMNYAMLRYLLQKKVQCELSNISNLLSEVTRNDEKFEDCFKIIKLLCQTKHIAMCSIPSDNIPTLLAAACYIGDIAFVDSLLKNRADIDCLIPYNKVPQVFKKDVSHPGLSPVACAAIGGNLQMIKYILDRGAVLSNKNYHSPLYYAVKMSKKNPRAYLKIVNYLVLEKECNTTSLRGCGVYFFATQEVKMFLQKREGELCQTRVQGQVLAPHEQEIPSREVHLYSREKELRTASTEENHRKEAQGAEDGFEDIALNYDHGINRKHRCSLM